WGTPLLMPLLQMLLLLLRWIKFLEYILFRTELKCIQCHLVSHQIVNSFSFANQVIFPFVNQHFYRAKARIVIARHHNAISACIQETQYITFFYFMNSAVGCESIGFADVANNSVNTVYPTGIRYVQNMMIRIVKHRADKMIQSGI